MSYFEKLFEKIRNQEKLDKEQQKAFNENYEWRIRSAKTKYIKADSFRVKGVKTFEEIPKKS